MPASASLTFEGDGGMLFEGSLTAASAGGPGTGGIGNETELRYDPTTYRLESRPSSYTAWSTVIQFERFAP